VKLPPDREYLTTADVAKLLRVSTPTVRKAIRDQGLPCVWLGKAPRIPAADFAAWLEKQKEAGRGRRSA
jgi:excisionase family DNA binding protein